MNIKNYECMLFIISVSTFLASVSITLTNQPFDSETNAWAAPFLLGVSVSFLAWSIFAMSGFDSSDGQRPDK